MAGSPAVVEQDTVEEITQCVEAVLKTQVGQRIEVPEFGLDDPTFMELAANETGEEIALAVEEWEPRAGDVLTDIEIEEALTRVRLTFRTGEPDNR